MTVARPIRLRAADGVELSARFVPGLQVEDDSRTAVVLAHGFTGHMDQDRVAAIIARLTPWVSVVAVDQRGHGRSRGRSTLGHREPMDVEAVAAWARAEGFDRVVTLGFSMGASVVLRHAALCQRGDGYAGADAVISVSGPAFWYYRGTVPMRWLHRAIGTPGGRTYLRLARGTRVDPTPWPVPPPLPPTGAARILSEQGIPLLIVHGDADAFFPLDHPAALHEAAPGSQMWIEPGFGHAEGSITPELVDRIRVWALTG